MNIPIEVGWTVYSKGELDKFYMSNTHHTIRIPDGRVLWHGDELWGPGATLFPGSDLFVDHELCMYADKVQREALASGVFVNRFWTYGPGSSQGWPGQMQTWAICWQSKQHSRYSVGRMRFLKMLEASIGRPADYAQRVLDCFMHGLGAEVGETAGVLSALKDWTRDVTNPLHSYLPWFSDTSQVVSMVSPKLDQALWGSSVNGPASVWEDPVFRNSLLLVRALMDLDGLALIAGLTIDEEAPVAIEDGEGDG